MRILLAASDRDLLESYQKLLTDAFGECVTAFDGTQVLADLAEERFDMVVLDRALPRVRHEELLRELSQKALPSVVLLDNPVTAHELAKDLLPSAYLSHPFLPEDMIGLMQNVLRKAASGKHFFVGNASVDVSAFCLEGGPQLTAFEIDLLYALTNKTSSDVYPGAFRVGAAVSALNEKFSHRDASVRIHYLPKKGFELVNIHE